MTEINYDHDNKIKANEGSSTSVGVSQPSVQGLVWLCVQGGGKISSYYSQS